VLNWIWLGLVLGAVVYAALVGRMQAVSDAIFESARSSVDLVIGLTGIMVFMLGLMQVARDGGLLRWVARGLAPIMRRLFPDVPEDHPAMGAMVMNFATNVLGLGNAATPFGLKSMVELERLNPRPGFASDPMILFLAINTSAITLMPPTGTIAVRAAAGSADPFAIWIPTLIATTCSTLAAIGAFYVLRARAARREPHAAQEPAARPGPDAPRAAEEPALPDTAELLGGPQEPAGALRGGLVALVALLLALGLALELRELAAAGPLSEALKAVLKGWLFPLLVAALLLVGLAGRVRIYESAVSGGREGLEVAVRILPYLLAILVAVGMFRASGALDLLIRVLDPLTALVGFPGEALPMALLRPLSGSGAFGVMSEIVTTHGPDSFIGNLACTIQGSTETTFYVLTLYCGAAGVRDVRYAIGACLAGDLAGIGGATAACHLFFG
jgi:spore maturation protein SpmA